MAASSSSGMREGCAARRQRRVEVAEERRDVAAAEDVVAAGTEQEDRRAGLGERVEVFAAPDHVVEGIAGSVEAADRVAFGDELVDDIVEDDRGTGTRNRLPRR